MFEKNFGPFFYFDKTANNPLSQPTNSFDLSFYL